MMSLRDKGMYCCVSENWIVDMLTYLGGSGKYVEKQLKVPEV